MRYFHIFEIALESKTSDDKKTEIFKWCEQSGDAIKILLAGLKLRGRCQMVHKVENNLNHVQYLCEGLKSDSSDKKLEEVKTGLEIVQKEIKDSTAILKKK
jgi:hypothetical protein